MRPSYRLVREWGQWAACRDGAGGRPAGPAGAIVAVVEAKLRPPPARPGIVPRQALVERLLAAPAAPVIWVVAPPGHGKTTLLAQWSARKGPRTGWVSIDRRDNDPAVLVGYLAATLDRLEPLDPAVFEALASPGVSVLATVLPRFLAAVSALTGPVALVLDNLETLENRVCLDAVAELALGLPAGSQVAIAARARPALPVALLRARGQVVEVGVAELAMNQGEGCALLAAAGAGLADPEAIELVERSEGWPVGLYLAALANRAGGQPGNASVAFTGDDRFLADYLDAELLARLAPERVRFLTRTAVLERLCGPLCDAILATSGSDRVLAELEDSNLLLVPLDRHREWYRYHQLFRELLLTELHRREPELAPELHTRAARWYEANGLPELAVDHAQAAGDADRVARLVAGLVFRAWTGGRVETIQRWLGWFEERGLVERYPPVAVLGAMIQAKMGNPAATERWADAVEHSMPAPGADPAAQTPPDGSTMEGYLALLRALLGRHGIGQMRADAKAAQDGLSPANPWRAAAMIIQAMTELVDGRADQADATLAQAVEVGRHAGAHARRLLGAGRALPARDPAERLGPGRRPGRAGAGDRHGRAAGRLHHEPAGARGSGAHGPASRGCANRQGAPYPGRPPATAAHRCDPGDGHEYTAGTGAGLPAPGRPRRRRGRPPPGPGHRTAATRPWRPARAGPGAVVGTGQGTHREPGRIIAQHRRVAPAPPARHPSLILRDRPAAVPVQAHGEDPGHLDLPQARRLLA
jgi:ATP/maltotriose-dependent transcriptional regulator MalT